MSNGNADLLAKLRLETDVDDAIVDVERVNTAVEKTGPAAAAANAPMAVLAAETNAVAAASAKAAVAVEASNLAQAGGSAKAAALGAAQAGVAAGFGSAVKGAEAAAKASTGVSAAMGVARVAAGGLLAMVGGPLGLGLMAGGVAFGFPKDRIAEARKATQDAQGAQATFVDAMAQSSRVLLEAGVNTRSFTVDTAGAIKPTDDLTQSTFLLTGQTLKLADARRQAALASLQEADRKLQVERARVAAAPARSTVKVEIGNKLDGSSVYGDMLASARLGQIDDELAAGMAQRVRLALVTKDVDKAKGKLGSDAGRKSASGASSDRQSFNAGVSAKDAAADVAAENARTAAIVAGGKAIDAWQISEAGRQAVEKVGLADKPKLTAAETALVASIRSRAEETERLKIANERIEKAVGLQRSADADTAALIRRSAAAAKGEAAIEALQVQEAGLQVLERLGVASLDDLTGAAREHAEAAIKSAKASETQAIATEKATRVASQVRDLDKRIDSEKRLAVAKAGGLQAEVEYAQAEAIRQEIERAGANLTDDQVAALTAKVKALFAVSAAADEAGLVADATEELRLARLTNQERDLEERVLKRIGLIKAQHLEWTKDEVEARARALALADQAAADDAKAIGDLRENLRDAFTSTGKLAFDDIASYAEQKLRAAVYDALLAKPFDIIINAVVGSLSGLGGSAGSAGAAGGAGGLASLFSTSGALKGLTTGSAALATKGLSALGMGGMDAAKYGAMAGTAIGGAGTGMLVSSVAGMLGLKQNKGNQIGGTIGGAIGSFIPIPGGTLIGSVLGNLVGGLIGGKKSNEAAVLDLDGAGAVTNVGGAKRNDTTTAAAQSIASAVAQIQAALVAGGATLGATVSKIDIGQRDATHLNFSNGTSIDSAVGDVSAAVEAATKAIIANAKWSTEAQTAYAQKMLAAGATLDQVVGVLQAAGGFGQSIDDAIAKLVDPAAYERKAALDAIEANYAALKDQAQQLIDAGLTTGDVLAKIDRLKDLQVEDALKRLAGAADSAAQALDPAAFAKSIQDGITSLSDPTGFARSKALAEISASIAAMREQATGLVAAGKLTSDVFDQLDKLNDLQVADSIKKLGDAASDAAAALLDAAGKQKAAGAFTGSIDDEILKLTNPAAYAQKSALDGIEADYQAKRAQALELIAAGLASGDVLTKLDALKNLQVQDALAQLAGAAADATDVFADARPRLQSWLDGLATSANSSLNPSGQRGAALSSYERLLALAKGGDADALSQITGSADQLLSSDRVATSSASDRLSLENRVRGDIQGLINQSGPSALASPQIVQLTKANTALEKLTAFLDPALIAARPPAPTEIKLSPWLQQMHQVQVEDQTLALSDLLNKLFDETKAAHADTVGGLAQLGKDISAGLGGLANAVAASAAGTATTIAGLAESIADLSRSNSLTNQLVKQAALTK